MRQTILKTENIDKYFYDPIEFQVLKNISFEVKKGETVGIVGRNGSGKSTLLQMICGTLTPSCGTIRTNGRVAALLELGSGFNPEFTGHFGFDRTALAEVFSQHNYEELHYEIILEIEKNDRKYPVFVQAFRRI